MWFGDLVTMKWWNDLWLNESFATYVSYLAKERATRFIDSWVSFASDEKTWAYRQDQLPTTHPIVADIPDVDATHLNFDGITYAKGASVLKQLVAWVGEKPFFEGLRTYFKTHEWGNTELPDFLAPLEKESGRDLHVMVEGVARDRRREHDLGRRRRRPAVGAATSGRPCARTAWRSGCSTPVRHRSTCAARSSSTSSAAETTVPELADEAPADLVLPNHKDLAYTKIRFDERSLATITDRLSDLGDPLARTLCWNAVWEMVRDADLAARRYVDIVLNNIAGEDDIGVVGDLIGRMAHARSTRTATRPTAMRSGRSVAARTRALPRGGRARLRLPARLGSRVHRIGELGRRHRVREGTARRIGDRPGLEIDTDLRWAIVASLAEAGHGDDSLIARRAGTRPHRRRRAPRGCGARVTSDGRSEGRDVGARDERHRALARDAPRARRRVQPHRTRTSSCVRTPTATSTRCSRSGSAASSTSASRSPAASIPKLYTQDVLDRTDALLAGDPPRPVRRILTEQRFESARTMRARASRPLEVGLVLARHARCVALRVLEEQSEARRRAERVLDVLVAHPRGRVVADRHPAHRIAVGLRTPRGGPHARSRRRPRPPRARTVPPTRA